MTKNDQVVFATIVNNSISALKETLPGMIKEVVQDLLEQNNHMLKREIRDEIYSANKALENQLRRDMQQMRLDIYSNMQKMRVEIVTDIGEILDQSILPQITSLDHRVLKIENQLATC